MGTLETLKQPEFDALVSIVPQPDGKFTVHVGGYRVENMERSGAMNYARNKLTTMMSHWALHNEGGR